MLLLTLIEPVVSSDTLDIIHAVLARLDRDRTVYISFELIVRNLRCTDSLIDLLW